MENLFGNAWERHVIIRPPWSVVTVLKCALKHWMAAVSEAFTRKVESLLKDLQLCISQTPVGGKKLQDVKFFLDTCYNVFQNLNKPKYPALKERSVTQMEVSVKFFEIFI